MAKANSETERREKPWKIFVSPLDFSVGSPRRGLWGYQKHIASNVHVKRDGQLTCKNGKMIYLAKIQ